VPGVLVEEVLELERPPALVGIRRIEGGLRLSGLQRLDDLGGVDDPPSVEIDDGAVFPRLGRRPSPSGLPAAGTAAGEAGP
jgi:hypothetical protein